MVRAGRAAIGLVTAVGLAIAPVHAQDAAEIAAAIDAEADGRAYQTALPEIERAAAPTPRSRRDRPAFAEFFERYSRHIALAVAGAAGVVVVIAIARRRRISNPGSEPVAATAHVEASPAPAPAALHPDALAEQGDFAAAIRAAFGRALEAAADTSGRAPMGSDTGREAVRRLNLEGTAGACLRRLAEAVEAAVFAQRPATADTYRAVRETLETLEASLARAHG